MLMSWDVDLCSAKQDRMRGAECPDHVVKKLVGSEGLNHVFSDPGGHRLQQDLARSQPVFRAA